MGMQPAQLLTAQWRLDSSVCVCVCAAMCAIAAKYICTKGNRGSDATCGGNAEFVCQAGTVKQSCTRGCPCYVCSCSYVQFQL